METSGGYASNDNLASPARPASVSPAGDGVDVVQMYPTVQHNLAMLWTLIVRVTNLNTTQVGKHRHKIIPYRMVTLSNYNSNNTSTLFRVGPR